MSRAHYRFDQTIALRLPTGPTLALQSGKLAAIFDEQNVPVCQLTGLLALAAYRALMAGGMAPLWKPVPQQPIGICALLQPALAAQIGRDAATLLKTGLRMEQVQGGDALARQLLTWPVWQIAVCNTRTPRSGTAGEPTVASNATMASAEPAHSNVDAAEPANIPRTLAEEMVAALAVDLWQAFESAGTTLPAAQPETAQLGTTSSINTQLGASTGVAEALPLVVMPLTEAIGALFAAEEWGWEPVNGSDDTLRAVYDGQHVSWICYTRILTELDQVIFYSVCPVSVPDPRSLAVAEYVSRVNSDLFVSNFELDFHSSTVRFRTSIDVTDVGLTPTLFRNLVYQNLVAMDLHLPDSSI